MTGLPTKIVVIVFHVLVLGSEGMGLYCIGKKQNWVDSMNECLTQRGTPLPYMVGLANVIDAQNLREGIEGNIWTSEYLKKIEIGATSEELCGFQYMSTALDKDQVFYGDCNKNRSYICWNSTTRKGTLEESNHEHAISTCDTVSRDVLKTIFKPGYYWLNDKLSAERMTLYVQYNNGEYELKNNPNGSLLKCGAYSRDTGLYFRKCTDQIISLCHFVNPPDTDVNRTCFKDSTTATKISTVTTSFTTPVNIVSAKVQSMDQSKETIKPAVTTSFDRPQSNLRDSTMKLVTGSLSNKNEAKTFKADRDLGTKVGLPVGLCLALICVIILIIYISRRYKCWNTTEKENNNTKAKHPGKQSTGRVVAHVNNSYEANEDTIAIKITIQEAKNDESNCPDKNPHYTDLDSEYDVAYKSNICQNSEDRNNLTETDYDVTGNALSCSSNTSNNIYNHFQSEVYDSSINVKREDICNNEYGIIQSKESESVYDSTRQVNDSSPCDNVYNQLSLAISRDGQIYNDFTVNTSQIGQAKVTDQTYDELK